MVASRPSFFGNVSSMKLFLLSVRRGYVAGFGSSFSYPRVRGSGGEGGEAPFPPGTDGRMGGDGQTRWVGRGEAPQKIRGGFGAAEGRHSLRLPPPTGARPFWVVGPAPVGGEASLVMIVIILIIPY